MPDALQAFTLAIALGANNREPPTEFRLFRAGENETTKGTFLFDEESQKNVLAEYKAHGIDLPIDWEHAMLMDETPVRDRRAAGWFELGIRDGALWAVNVRWTAEADAALRAGEWRFFSPAFLADKKTGRISQLLNVAICNLPATRQLDALVAAKRGALPHPTTTEQAPGAEGTTMPLNLSVVALALGLAESAAEPDILTTAARRKADTDRLVTLTGAKSPEEAFGVLAAWKASHDTVAGLLAADKERAEKAEKAERAALLKQGEEEGKITNPLKAWAEKQSVESLRGFVSAAQPVVPPNRTNPDRASISASGKSWTELSTMEQHRLLNDDPATANALRAAAKAS